MDSPHDSEGRASQLIKGLVSGDDLPQDDAPAEDVTLLGVGVA